MRRLLQPLFMMLMLLGLLGSMSAYAWKTVLRPSVVKASQEEDTDKEGASDELLVDLDIDVWLPEWQSLPVERNMGPQWQPSRQLVQPPVPEQAVVPRVIVVWRPPCQGLDEEPALS